MWRRLLPIVFVFSLAMNAATLGVWLMSALAGDWPASDIATAPFDEHADLDRRLGIDERQRREIEPMRMRFRQAAGGLSERAAQAQAELIALIESPDPDRDAIAAKRAKIAAIQQRLQEAAVDHLFDHKEVLTPEQQEILFSELRDRGGWGRGVGEGRQRRQRHGQNGADEARPGGGPPPWGHGRNRDGLNQ